MHAAPRKEPSGIVWSFQRGVDVKPERTRDAGSGADYPAEPDHWGDGQQHARDLVYLGVAGLTLGLLDWFRSEAPVPADATEAAAMTVPIGAAP